MIERFWLPLEQSYFEEDGYLADRTEWRNTAMKTLGELDSRPCLLLLGEPGIGKTTALKEHVRKLSVASTSLVKSIDLKLLVDFNFDSKLFRSEWFTSWQSSDSELHLYLDSLDECMGRTDNIAQRIVHELGALQPEELARLRLRIACRTGQLPPSIVSTLQELFEQSRHVYELLPLRRQDAEHIVRTKQLADPDAFIREIQEKNLGPLASRPITLQLLCRLAGNEPLPRSRAEIYRRGCDCLCDEPDRDRQQRSLREKKLNRPKRLEIAEALAAASVLCQRLILTPDDTSVSASVGRTLAISDFARDIKRLGRQGTDYCEADVNEILTDTSLFTSAGPTAFAWQHQTYAEFLAASWLAKSTLPDRDKVALLAAPEDPSVVVPALREVAAWLATLRKDVFELLCRTQPDILIRSDLAALDEQTRATLCEQLLTAYELGAKVRFEFDHEYYRPLRHPGLELQLRKYLNQQGSRSIVRKLAVHIAWGCEIEELVPDLLQIAFDPLESVDIRYSAVDCLLDTAKDVAVLSSLKRLLQLPITEDPDDEICGRILNSLWRKNLLSASEALAALRPARHRNLIGAYHGFCFKLTTSWPATEYLAALSWVVQQEYDYNLPSDFRELMVFFNRGALSHLDEPGVQTLLVEIIHKWCRRGDNPFSEQHGDRSAVVPFPTEHARRQLLAAFMEHPQTTDRDISRCFREHLERKSWPVEQDSSWLVAQFTKAASSFRSRWGSLIRLHVENKRHLGFDCDPVIEAVREMPELMDVLADQYQPIVIGSARAHALKQERERIDELYAQHPRYSEKAGSVGSRRAIEQPFSTSIACALNSAAKKGEQPWAWIADYVCNSAGSNCEVELRGRIAAAALRYIQTVSVPAARQSSFSDEWTFGFFAFQFLFTYEPQQLEFLTPLDWAKWAPVVVCCPESTSWNGLPDLWKRFFAEASVEFAEAVVLMLAKSSVNPASHKALAACWNTQLAETLLSAAKVRRAKGLPVGNFYGILAKNPIPDGMAWICAQLQTPIPADLNKQKEARLVVDALLCRAIPPVWDAIQPLLGNAPNLILQVLDLPSNTPSLGQQSWWGQRLRADAIAELYSFLQAHFPREEWESTQETTDSDDRIQDYAFTAHRLKSSLRDELRERATPEALAAAKKIAGEHSDSIILRELVEQMTEALRSLAYAESAQSLSQLCERIAGLQHAQSARATLTTDRNSMAQTSVHIQGTGNVVGVGNITGSGNQVTVNMTHAATHAPPSTTKPTSGPLKPSRASVRALLTEVLRTDSDLESFCVDHFYETKLMFSNGMDTKAKQSLLLTRESATEVVARLEEAAPEAYARYAHLLRFEQ